MIDKCVGVVGLYDVKHGYFFKNFLVFYTGFVRLPNLVFCVDFVSTILKI